MSIREFCYSFHLNNSPTYTQPIRATIGDLRELVKTLDLLALDNDVEIEECQISIYVHSDHYPYISDKRHIKLPDTP